MKARLPQGMGGGPQNMQNMLRQAQKMQENIEKKQAELAEGICCFVRRRNGRGYSNRQA